MNKTILKEKGFSVEVEQIEHGICPICSCIVDKTQFRDDISLQEYRISGMCPSCQFHIFDDIYKEDAKAYLCSIPEYRELVRLALEVLNISASGYLARDAWNNIVSIAKHALFEKEG